MSPYGEYTPGNLVVPARNGIPIVDRWLDHSAPTGEGVHVRTADGQVWHEAPIGPYGGTLVGDRIVPRD